MSLISSRPHDSRHKTGVTGLLVVKGVTSGVTVDQDRSNRFDRFGDGVSDLGSTAASAR